MSDTSTRKNRLTFSLRGLFIAITIIAAASAAIWTAALPARREHAAAQSLIALARSVDKPVVKPAVAVSANAVCNSVPSPNHTPPVVIEYEPAQGVDRILCWIAGSPGRVEKIEIWQSDAAARCFFDNARNFKRLKEVSIYCDAISGSDIATLGHCTGLSNITLGCDELDGSELRPLGALPNLTQLTVKSDALDCGVFAAVGECRGLWFLDLQGPIFGERIHEGSFGRFSELNLDLLVLTGDFPDVALKHVADMPALTYLSISSETLTDRGMAFLANNDSIQDLSIIGSRITDASIDTLRSMTKLRQLNDDDTSITAAGRQRLGALPPDVQ